MIPIAAHTGTLSQPAQFATLPKSRVAAAAMQFAVMNKTLAMTKATMLRMAGEYNRSHPNDL